MGESVYRLLIISLVTRKSESLRFLTREAIVAVAAVVERSGSTAATLLCSESSSSISFILEQNPPICSFQRDGWLDRKCVVGEVGDAY